MNSALAAIGKHVAPVVAVAACWVVVFQLNGLLFSSLEQSRWVHWIFLPAAVRVIALLLCGTRGAIGLALGAFVTLAPQDLSFPNAVILPVSSALAPWIAINIWKRVFRIRDDLFGLAPLHIIFLSLACALTNSALLNLFLTLAGQSHDGTLPIMGVIIGDTFGTAIVMLLLSVALSSASHRPRHR